MHANNRIERPAHSGTITVRMRPDLRACIDKAAADQHMSASTWLRNAALTSLMLAGIGTILSYPDEPDAS